MNKDDVILGVSVAVLAYVAYQHFTVPAAAAARTVAAPVNTTAPVGNAVPGLLAGALWKTLTFTGKSVPTDATGNVVLDQTYSSTSYNPDAISQAIGQDTIAAMGAAGQADLNTYGFSMP